MAENPTEAVGPSQNGNLPEPDLPSFASVDGVSGHSFISLQQTSSHIQIRQGLNISTANNMAVARRYSETVHSIFNVHGATGTNHILMHEITDGRECLLQREISAEYVYRLETFHNWPLWFLEPAVLAEAKFCFTGQGDTVKCTICEGKLSNWKPGDDPRQQHLQKFGFSCC